MVLGVITTSARESDTKNLELVLNKIKLARGSYVQADKGYYGKPNDTVLSDRGLKSRIMKKVARNRPLRESEKMFNKLISKTRYKVERTFGGWQRHMKIVWRPCWLTFDNADRQFSSGVATNLYRSPRIAISNSVKVG